MSAPTDAMATRPQARALLDFPEEILTSIFGLIVEDPSWRGREILNFRLACRRLYEVSEATCYQHVSIDSAGQYNSLLRSFSACPQRQNYVQHFDMDLYWYGQHKNCPLTTNVVIDFPNMKSLDIQLEIIPELGTQGWLNELQYQLNTNHFSKLREASLNLDYGETDPRWCTLRIKALLQAPVLTKLSLVGLDLRKASLENLPNHEACLKDLYLEYCHITEESLSAILAAPAALTSFKIAAGNPDNETPLSLLPVGRELEILRQSILILAAKQRCLEKLTICLWPRDASSSQTAEVTSNALDISLSKLPPLMELCICAGHFAEWFPISPFLGLPVCEVLKLHVSHANWEKAALSHLELRRQTNLTEVPPRHLEIIAWDYPKAATDAFQQKQDEKLRRGIDLLMTHRQLEQLTYHQKGEDVSKLMLAKLGEGGANGEFFFEEKAYSRESYSDDKTLVSHTSEVRQLLPN